MERESPNGSFVSGHIPMYNSPIVVAPPYRNSRGTIGREMQNMW